MRHQFRIDRVSPGQSGVLPAVFHPLALEEAFGIIDHITLEAIGDVVNEFKPGSSKLVYTHSTGSDLSNFRFPDDELLKLSVPFSDREFEIIRLIESGMTSEEIAEKIFLSVHTVNTHRRNILTKSGKETMSELIYDLMDQGVL